MKRPILLTVVAAFGLLSVSVSVRQVLAQGNTSKDFAPPIVFQAAGPTADSIQGLVDEFRAALGEPNNGNAPGPLATGRREINWDGGGANDTTTAPVTPFNVFLNTRGGQFPASPGDGSLSFFGILFGDARIARVRITSGDIAPGPDDDGKHDIVMMDDFIYGEPQPLPQ